MDAKKEIERAYTFWKKGRICEIWKCRREADLPDFDQALMELVRSYEYQLTGGDPTQLTQDQMADCIKVNNQLMIGMIKRR